MKQADKKNLTFGRHAPVEGDKAPPIGTNMGSIGADIEDAMASFISSRDAARRHPVHPSEVYPRVAPEQVIKLVPDLEAEVCKAALTLYDGPCPVCGGSGLYPKDGVPDGSLVPVGGWAPCPCADLNLRIDAINRVKIPVDLDLASWHGNVSELWDPKQTWVENINGFIGSWTPTSTGLYLSGTTGSGKSHLLALIAFTLAARLISVKWVSWRGMLADIKLSFGKKQGGVSDYYDRHIRRPQVVIFDDIGAGRSAKELPWLEEVYSDIIAKRAASRKCMLLSSNFTLPQLAERVGDDRAMSRLARVVSEVPMPSVDLRGGGYQWRSGLKSTWGGKGGAA